MDNGTEAIRELAAEFRQKADALDQLAAKTAAFPGLATELATILQGPAANGAIRPPRFRERKDHPGYLKICETFKRSGNPWMTAREISKATRVQRCSVYAFLTDSPRYKKSFEVEADSNPKRWRLREVSPAPQPAGPKLSRP